MAFGCCRNCAGSVAHVATTSEGHENPPVRGRFGGFPALARFVKSAHAVQVGVSGTQLIWTRLDRCDWMYVPRLLKKFILRNVTTMGNGANAGSGGVIAP